MTSKIAASSPTAKGSVTRPQLQHIWRLTRRTNHIAEGAGLSIHDVLERIQAQGVERFPDLTRLQASRLIDDLKTYTEGQKQVGPDHPKPLEWDSDAEWERLFGFSPEDAS